MQFKVGDKVKRNPKIWRNDKAIFTIVGTQGPRFVCQRPGKTRCPFTNKLEPYQPLPYQANELIPA